jgi:hypothetical protein
MVPEVEQEGFAHHWQVTVLKRRPLILPRRRYVYPRDAEEVERGALELSIQPGGNLAKQEPFLATCALGFADPRAPTGVWTCPHPDQLCAVAGGYAYLIDTLRPERFEQVPYRPVFSVHPVYTDPGLLLFAGNRAILAYGRRGRLWESPPLSSEGIEVTSTADGLLQGLGWDLMSDREVPFSLDLRTGMPAG